MHLLLVLLGVCVLFVEEAFASHDPHTGLGIRSIQSLPSFGIGMMQEDKSMQGELAKPEASVFGNNRKSVTDPMLIADPDLSDSEYIGAFQERRTDRHPRREAARQAGLMQSDIVPRVRKPLSIPGAFSASSSAADMQKESFPSRVNPEQQADVILHDKQDQLAAYSSAQSNVTPPFVRSKSLYSSAQNQRRRNRLAAHSMDGQKTFAGKPAGQQTGTDVNPHGAPPHIPISPLIRPGIRQQEAALGSTIPALDRGNQPQTRELDRTLTTSTPRMIDSLETPLHVQPGLRRQDHTRLQERSSLAQFEHHAAGQHTSPLASSQTATEERHQNTSDPQRQPRHIVPISSPGIYAESASGLQTRDRQEAMSALFQEQRPPYNWDRLPALPRIHAAALANSEQAFGHRPGGQAQQQAGVALDEHVRVMADKGQTVSLSVGPKARENKALMRDGAPMLLGDAHRVGVLLESMLQPAGTQVAGDVLESADGGNSDDAKPVETQKLAGATATATATVGAGAADGATDGREGSYGAGPNARVAGTAGTRVLGNSESGQTTYAGETRARISASSANLDEGAAPSVEAVVRGVAGAVEAMRVTDSGTVKRQNARIMGGTYAPLHMPNVTDSDVQDALSRLEQVSTSTRVGEQALAATSSEVSMSTLTGAGLVKNTTSPSQNSTRMGVFPRYMELGTLAEDTQSARLKVVSYVGQSQEQAHAEPGKQQPKAGKLQHGRIVPERIDASHAFDVSGNAANKHHVRRESGTGSTVTMRVDYNALHKHVSTANPQVRTNMEVASVATLRSVGNVSNGRDTKPERGFDDVMSSRRWKDAHIHGDMDGAWWADNVTVVDSQDSWLDQWVLHDPFYIPTIQRRFPTELSNTKQQRELRHAGNWTVKQNEHAGVAVVLGSVSLVALAVAAVTMIGSFLSALVGFAFALTTTSLLSNLVGSRTAQVWGFFFVLNNMNRYACVMEFYMNICVCEYIYGVCVYLV